MNVVLTVCVSVNLLLTSYLVWVILGQRDYLVILGKYLTDTAKSTSTELESAQKKLDTLGKVLNIYEKETQILQKHRDSVKQMQSRFNTREPR